MSAFDVATGRNRWRSHVGGWVLQPARPSPSAGCTRRCRGRGAAPPHFLPQAAGLAAIERSDGRIAWFWPAAAMPGAFLYGLVAAPTVVGDRIVVGGVDGSLHAFAEPGRP